MVRRLLIGLVLGLLVGGAIAAGLIAGLGVQTFAGTEGMLLGYLAAALAGAGTGLVAGKPIWSKGGKVEAGLKSFFGALLGAGLMFALHRWVNWSIAIPALGAASPTPIGDLPEASLPLLAAVLGGFFELDNTGEVEPAKGKNADRARVAAEEPGRKARVAAPASPPKGAPAEVEDDEAEGGSRRAKR
ncbi:MAG TPA: hypothetical protein VGM06_03710 [Polyangiaceae bacterium]|jgi:hypothetical protein